MGLFESSSEKKAKKADAAKIHRDASEVELKQLKDGSNIHKVSGIMPSESFYQNCDLDKNNSKSLEKIYFLLKDLQTVPDGDVSPATQYSNSAARTAKLNQIISISSNWIEKHFSDTELFQNLRVRYLNMIIDQATPKLNEEEQAIKDNANTDKVKELPAASADFKLLSYYIEIAKNKESDNNNMYLDEVYKGLKMYGALNKEPKDSADAATFFSTKIRILKGIKHYGKAWLSGKNMTDSTVHRNFVTGLVEENAAVDNEIEGINQLISNSYKDVKVDETEKDYRLNYIFTPEEFKKLTSRPREQRGEKITKIDVDLLNYQKLDMKNADAKRDVLKAIIGDCSYWINYHALPENKNIDYRKPIIAELLEAAKKIYMKDNGDKAKQDLEALDASKGVSLIAEKSSVNTAVSEIPQIGEFKKMTSLSGRRSAYLRDVDDKIVEYHAKFGKGDVYNPANAQTVLKDQYMSYAEKLTNLYTATNTYVKHAEDKLKIKQDAALLNVKNTVSRLHDETNKLRTMLNAAKTSLDAAAKPAAQTAAGSKPAEKQEFTKTKATVRTLPTFDAFQQLTYSRLHTRGDYLSSIDNLLLKYDSYRLKSELTDAEQEDSQKILIGLHNACDRWLAHHQGDNSSQNSARRMIINNMVGENGLIANEEKLMLAGSITHSPTISEKLLKNPQASGTDPSKLFHIIPSSIQNKPGTKTLKFTGGVNVTVTFGFFSSASFEFTYEHELNSETELKDYSKDYEKTKMTEEDLNTTLKSSDTGKVGVKAGAAMDLLSVGASASFGDYTQTHAENPAACSDLLRFSRIKTLRRLQGIPSWLTNFIMSHHFDKSGYSITENYAAQAINVLGRNNDNYMESGWSAGAGGKMGVKVLGSAEAETGVEFAKKRFDRTSILAAMKELDSANTKLTDTISAEDMAKEYKKLAGFNEQGEVVNKNISADIHRKIQEKGLDQQKEVNSSVNLDTLFKSFIREYSGGKLSKITIPASLQLRDFSTASGMQNSVASVLREFENCFYRTKDSAVFDMRTIDLTGFIPKVASFIKNAAPADKIFKFSNYNGITKTIFDKLSRSSVKLNVELDVEKRAVKIFMDKSYFDFMDSIIASKLIDKIPKVASESATDAGKAKVKSFVDGISGIADKFHISINKDDLTNSLLGAANLSVTPIIGFSATATSLIGFWSLPPIPVRSSPAAAPAAVKQAPLLSQHRKKAATSQPAVSVHIPRGGIVLASARANP